MSSETKRDVLPKTLKPIHYDLEVFDIDVLKNTFQGKVKIDLEVKEDTDSIVLHASDLTFNEIKITYSVTKTESHVNVVSTDFDTKAQTATIKLAETLKAAPSAKVVLFISYNAKIRTNMNGFYRSDYKDKYGKDQVMLSTQFEATEARSSLPCFDEPNLKASFQLTITVAEDFTALSNTPVLSSKTLDDGKKKGAVESTGLKVVKFQQAPIMSTYLFAWAIGKVDYIEAFTEKSYDGKKIPVRIYTQEGVSEQGRFGLEVATKVVDFFSSVFEIDYVLPKLDLISVPAYSHNAMENWGLITFRPTALLFDPKTSDPQYKKKVAYVVAHELAHQWFGNLVTMNWWDELWLNEGFATWVGYYAIESIFPEWRIFDVVTATDLQVALKADGSRSSHPVEVPIQSAADIDQVFDQISYLKGGAVINQIARTLGVDVFLKGVSSYLKKNKFGNGTTNDLLESISEVSGIDVVSKASDWIRKIGYPYVTVEKKDNDVTFTQKRFLFSGDATGKENETTWWVPLNLSTGKGDQDRIGNVELTSKSETVSRIGQVFFKVNKDTTGFYRTVYDDKTRESIKDNLARLTPTDKIGFITDAVATAVAGLTKTSDALDIIKLFKGETDPVVWKGIFKSLRLISVTWSEKAEISKAFKKFKADLVTAIALSLGFEASQAEDFLTQQLRVESLTAAIHAGVPEIISEAKKLYEHPDKIDPSLRSVVYQAVISSPDATEADFDSIYGIINSSKALDTREIVLSALGTIFSPSLVHRAISLISNPEIPIMDVQFVAISLSKNGVAREHFWKFIKDNYDEVYTRLNANRVVFDRFIKFTLGRYADQAVADDIEKFFKEKDIYGFERSLEQVIESVKFNDKWVKRDEQDFLAWLKKESYI